MYEVNKGDHGIKKILQGDTFSLPVGDFMIAPVSADSALYIESLADGSGSKVKVGDIASGEYTKVHGAVPGTIFSVDASEDITIQW